MLSFGRCWGSVAQPAIPTCTEKFSPRDLDVAYRGPVSRSGCHPLPGVCKGNQQQDGFWWSDPGLKTEVSGTQADTGILEIYRFFRHLGFLEAISRQYWHFPIRLSSLEFSFTLPAVVQPLSLYKQCNLRSPSTWENKPSHQGDPDCPVLGVTGLEILCRFGQWAQYLFPIPYPSQLYKPDTVGASPSALVHDHPGKHAHVGHDRWEVFSQVGMDSIKNWPVFPPHSGQQGKRHTLNLFTPSGSSSRFSREDAHLAVLLGVWWLLLELPSLSWMSAKQSSETVYVV